jgi:hypothetical protein
VSESTSPREAIQELEQAAVGTHTGRERFRGYGVMGLTFHTGHVLGLRRFPASSIGPGYTSVWHRSPDGGWSFWSTVPPAVSCARYTGDISDDTREAAIRLDWPDPYRMTVDTDEPRLAWEVTVASTPVSRALSAMMPRLPRRVLDNERILRLMGPMAGALLGAGRLALTGAMPNRQTFHLVPSHVWLVAASRAQLDGEDLGSPAPLPRQASIGDFRIPQRGLFAIGDIDFDLLDPNRHSTRTQRGSA